MEVIFNSRHAQSGDLRHAVEERVRFVMRRLTWLVPRASVQLSDINGPRGGVDKRCQLRLKTQRTGTVVITSIARDWLGAVDGALARATPVLLKAWRRARAKRRADRKKPEVR